MTTTTHFDVLHALRVKGLATDDALTALTGLSPQEISAAVAALDDAGFVARRDGGRISGVMLTPAGRGEYERLAADTDLTDDARAAVASFHERFGPVNSEFKAVCAAWQLRPDGTANDHADKDYDAAVIADLVGVHGRVDEALTVVDTEVPRLGRYRARLAAALAKVRAGDTAAFARPLYDSYHDIWMELHQDLLLTAGRERGAGDE